MATKLTTETGEVEIESVGEIWSVRQGSSDGEPREVACPDGEMEARRLQKAYGGQLLRRTMYVTPAREEKELSDATTFAMVE